MPEREYDDEDRPRRRRRPDDEFEEDDRPRRPSRARDEDDERPVRRRRSRDDHEDEDDDYDDRPRRRRRRRAVAAPSGVVTLVGVINLMLAGLVVIAALAIMFLGATVMAWITGTAPDLVIQGPNNQKVVAQVQGLAAMGTMMFVAMGFCFILIGALPLALAGYGVLKRQQWGRILTLILGGLAILGVVFGVFRLPAMLFNVILNAAYAGLTYGVLLQPQFAEEFE